MTLKRSFAAVLAAVATLCGQAQAAAIKPIGINPSTGQQTQIAAPNTIQAPAPTTANASINLPHGTAPTSPNNGDFWTTSTAAYIRINGATVALSSGSGVSAGGSNGQVQYNASGALDGFTLAGDCTLAVPSITCTKTSGVNFGYFATGTDAANLTGTVSVNRFNGGSGASTSTFLRGDGTWVAPSSGVTSFNTRSGAVTLATSDVTGLGANWLPLTDLANVGGNSYLGNTSSTTGAVTAYVIPDCHGSATALQYTQAGATGMTCGTITAVSGGANPFAIGGANVKSGTGVPSASSDPIGSLYLRTDVSQLYGQLTPTATLPTLVQGKAFTGTSVTLAATPAAGDLLIAECWGYTAVPGIASGWTSVLGTGIGVNRPGDSVGYKFAVSGESTSQTPCTSNSPSAQSGTIYEVSGVTAWADSYEGGAFVGSSPATYSTLNANDLVLGSFASDGAGSDPGVGTVTGLTGALSNAHTCCAAGGGGSGAATGAQSFSGSGSAVSAGWSFANGGFQAARLVVLKPPTASWKLITETWKNAGTTLNTWPLTVNVSTGLNVADDGLGNLTLTNTVTAPTGANPTATAGPTAVNGSAATFMRSDAAPAVQQGSASQKGIVQVDGTTITAASGVISATGPTISAGSTGNCVQWTSATALGNSGSACGAGGGGGTTNNYYAGALTYLGSVTASSSATVDLTGMISSSYDDYLIEYQDVTLATNGANLNFRFSADNGSTWDSGTNYETAIYQTNQGTFSANANTGTATAQGTVFAGASNTSLNVVSGTLALHAPASANWKILNSHAGSMATDSNTYNQIGSTRYKVATTINAVRFLASSGNINGGKFRVYGIGASDVTVNPQPGLPVICEVVTSGSAASVTVGGGSGSCPTLPSTYRDLMVVVTGRMTAAVNSDQLGIQFNGDTGGSSYNIGTITGSGSTAVSSSAASSNAAQFGTLPGSSATANYQGQATAFINNYAGTTFYKTVFGTSTAYYGSTVTNILGALGGAWKSTAAITSLTIKPNTAFVDGTVVTVYGIGGSPTATLPVVPPQGRLTLTSNTPVMTADATAQTTVYWAPLPGGQMPVGNIIYRPGQLTYVLNTTAHASGSLYDLGAYNSSGAITLCTAPAWTNATTRAAAVAQDATNGVYVNSASLTCNLSGGTTTTTIAAGQWTYLGTFHASANGQASWSCGPAAAGGGGAAELGLYNAYNRVPFTCQVRDNTASWAYGTGTWRAKNAAATGSGLNNRFTFVDGLQQSPISGTQTVFVTVAGCQAGMDLDSTSATPQLGGQSNVVAMITTPDRWNAQLGLHYVQAVEWGSGSCTFSGASAGLTASGFTITLENHIPLLLPMALFRRRRRKPANDNAERRAA